MIVRTSGEQQRPRPALTAARKKRGMTQEQAAEAFGVGVTTWGRWERGTQEVRPVYQARLAKFFKVPPTSIAEWLDGSASAEPMPWLQPAVTGGLATTLESSTQVWRWDVDASRRELLAAMPFVPGFLAEWLLGWSLDAPSETRARTAGGTRVGMADVERITDARAAFMSMDHVHGGGLVRPAVVDFLHHQVAPLLNGSYNDEVGAKLMIAAAGMTRLAGWEAYDLDRQGLAQVSYGRALELAKAARDALTGAWVLAAIAQQAIDLKEPKWAVRAARAARKAVTGAAPPRVEALLLVREARATALGMALADTDQHSAARTEQLLGRAEIAFGRAVGGSDSEPAWISTFGAAELNAEAGCAWRLIGAHRRAAECASTALRGFGSTFVRSAQFNKVHLAQAQLGLGELESALTVARGAVPDARALTSRRSIGMVRAFDQEVGDAYGGERAVSEWRDWLRTELPSAV